MDDNYTDKFMQELESQKQMAFYNFWKKYNKTDVVVSGILDKKEVFYIWDLAYTHGAIGTVELHRLNIERKINGED